MGNLRASFGISPAGYTGVDIEEGPNVDVVADLCAPNRAHFGCVYASALLEHVANPFQAASTLTGMLRCGGHLCYVGPWVWGYHAYPDDLWRLCFSGLQKLFPALEWQEWFYSGTLKGRGGTHRQPYASAVHVPCGPAG